MGSYHYVSGIDTSSSASLAAYINSLTYSIEETQAWFTKGPSWKVKNGCFWCVCIPKMPTPRSNRFCGLGAYHGVAVSTRFHAWTCA